MIDLEQLELHRRGPALRWAVARFAFDTFPQFAGRALAINSARLCASNIPKLFSRDLREIPNSLNEDLLDLLGRCERTLSNQFTLLAHSEEFPQEIDWGRHQGTAWGMEMHAFEYGLDLALNYRISGDPRYARHLRYLMAHWIVENPPGQGDGWLLPALARRVRNWVLASDLARQDWENDAAFFSIVNRSLALQAEFLSCSAQPSNSFETRLDSARALALAGRFFGGHRGAELGAAGREMLSRQLDRHFDTDGRVTQSRPAAQLRFAQALIEYLAFQPAAIGDESNFKDRVDDLISEMAGTLLPDGTLPLFGESPAPPGDELADVFALAAVILNSPEWKNLAGKFGIIPYMILGEPGLDRFRSIPDANWRPAICLQPQAGLYRLIGTDSSAVVINGRLPVSLSDHQDALSYELALNGQRLVVDSGVSTLERDSEARYFATPRAHNVLLVDEAGPRCTGPDGKTSMATLSAPDSEMMGLRLSHSGFSSLGINHSRAWFRLAGDCWAVLDQLVGRGQHKATSLIHFYPTFDLEVAENAVRARSRSMTVCVVPLGRTHPQIIATRGGGSQFEGWYSPAMGIKYATAVLRFEWEITSWPWLGGYLIFPASELCFEMGESDASSRKVCFRLGKNNYTLSIAGAEAAWMNLI